MSAPEWTRGQCEARHPATGRRCHLETGHNWTMGTAHVVVMTEPGWEIMTNKERPATVIRW